MLKAKTWESLAGQPALSAERPAATRIAWIDSARGIGIILVVFGHALRGLLSAGSVPEEGWREVDYILYSFHMPLFMFLAGMNVPRSLPKPMFLQKKARSILWPYFLWSVIHGLTMVAAGRFTNSDFEVSRLLSIAYAPISPFWFLYVLFLFMIVVKIWSPDRILLGASLVLLSLSPLIGQPTLYQFSYFLFFFVLGALFTPPTRPGLLLVAGSAIFAAGHGVLLWQGLQQNLHYYAPALLPLALAGAAAVLGLAMLTTRLQALVWLGQASMAIYVMHIIFTAGFRAVFSRLGVEDPFLLVTLVTLAGVIGPACVYVMLKKLRLARLTGLA